MSALVIREAKREDCQGIRQLIQELADFEQMPDGPKIDHTVLEKDGFDTENPLFYAYVAILDNVMIGYAIYFYTYSTWSRKVLHLEDIYVTSTHRKQNVGNLLFRTVAEKAVKMDCARMNLCVLNWNPAQEFYLKRGAVDLTKEEGWHLFRIERNALEELCNTN